MISISKFRLEFNPEKNIYFVISLEEVICPVCGGLELKPKGRRKRKVIMPDAKKKTLKIRRLRCCKCKKIHHELPDIIVPYKRLSAEIIENIINDTESGMRIDETKEPREECCENSTIMRIKAWWATMQLYINGVLASLKEKYGIMSSIKRGSAYLLPQIVRALVNTHLWPGTRSALPPR